MPYITHIEEQDFPRLFAIEQAAHVVPWSFGTLKNNQGARYLNLKIQGDDGEILGFAICQTVLDEATLFNIAIDPPFQAQGLGKYLLNQLIEKLREQGIRTLWLEVRQSNIGAQRLYEQCGFNRVDTRKNYYPTAAGGRENAIIMALYL